MKEKNVHMDDNIFQSQQWYIYNCFVTFLYFMFIDILFLINMLHTKFNISEIMIMSVVWLAGLIILWVFSKTKLHKLNFLDKKCSLPNTLRFCSVSFLLMDIIQGLPAIQGTYTNSLNASTVDGYLTFHDQNIL